MSGSNQQLLKLLESEVDQALQQAGVLEMGRCCWVGEDEVDPEFVGHAMWRSSPPLGCSYMLGDGPPPAFFPEWLQFLAVTGADFEGLMAAARLSIGLALVYRPAAESGFHGIGGGNFFDLHVMSAMVALGSASDRARDLFIAAVFEMETKAYEKAWDGENSNGSLRRRKEYVTPFDDAPQRLQARSVLDIKVSAHLAALPGQAARLQKYRIERNRLVHELATEMGMRERTLVKEAEKGAVTRSFTTMTVEDITRGAEAADQRRRGKVLEQLTTPMEWYKLLLRAASDVFAIQYHAAIQSEAVAKGGQ